MTHARLDLLTALDALTKPTTFRHNGSNHERPALLAQLRAAIASSVSAGGGKSLPSQRIPIDPHAMDVYGHIARDIRIAHADLAGRSSDRHPEDVLRAWHIVFTASNPRDEHIDTWTQRINDWTAEVQRILDPPRTVEVIDTPCIACGKAETINGNGDLQAAIVVEYRRNPDGEVHDVVTICRACRSVWEGKHGADSFTRYADEQAGHATPYEIDVPAQRGMRYDGALNVAREAFEQVGAIHGRIRVTATPTIAEPRWTFTADIRDPYAVGEDSRTA